MGDPVSLAAEKALLRKKLRERLKALSPREKARRAGEIQKRLLNHPRFMSARSLLVYKALSSEVDTEAILKEALKKGKRVYLPRVDPAKKRIWLIETTNLKDLQPGACGILEPPFDVKRLGRPEDLALAIVPGLGFDRGGGRLGRGEGYFDRFLAEAKKAYKIGLAFECQILDKVPCEAGDVKVDEVLIG